MYKIFEITYNDGSYHFGTLPHSFYIAKTKEEVIENSKFYKKCVDRGGHIWIDEVSGLEEEWYFENLEDFNVEVVITKKIV